MSVTEPVTIRQTRATLATRMSEEPLLLALVKSAVSSSWNDRHHTTEDNHHY